MDLQEANGLPPTYCVALGDGAVLYQPATDRLAVLNDTGRLVWDLAREGYEPDEIAAIFGRQFGLSSACAQADVRGVLTPLASAGFVSHPTGESGPGPSDPPSAPDPMDARTTVVADCGTFRFGAHLINIRSSLAGIDAAYFARFGHRTANVGRGADAVELVADSLGYRLTFRGETLAEEDTLPDLLGRFHEALLSWEYPNTDFLVYFHAAAVCRGGHSILLPGGSGVGKSTLTAWLVARGFGYLGDDLIAMRAADGTLLPSPTLLSLKSGAWPILEPLYPALPQRPRVQCNGRIIRYLTPDGANRDGAAAPPPALIVFPRYDKDQPTRRKPLPPLLTMARLIESNLALRQPVSRGALSQFIRFVEQTPAFELAYSDLQSATAAIDALLADVA